MKSNEKLQLLFENNHLLTKRELNYYIIKRQQVTHVLSQYYLFIQYL